MAESVKIEIRKEADSIYMEYFATNEEEIKAIIKDRLSPVSINAELKDFVFDYEKKEVHFKWTDDADEEWENMIYHLHELNLINQPQSEVQ